MLLCDLRIEINLIVNKDTMYFSERFTIYLGFKFCEILCYKSAFILTNNDAFRLCW